MIAEKLRELLASTLAQHIGKNDRVAVEAFYRNRGFSPIWITNASANERAKNATTFLNGVDADALDPRIIRHRHLQPVRLKLWQKIAQRGRSVVIKSRSR